MSAGYNLDIDLYKLHEKYAIPMGEKLSEDIFNYYENKKLGSKGGKSKRDKFIKEFVEICQRNKAEIFTAILAYYGVERQTAAENRKNDSKEKVVVADDINEMFGKLDEISHIMSNAIFGDFKSYVQVSKYVINERFAKCKINKDGSIREIDSFHPEKTNENATLTIKTEDKIETFEIFFDFDSSVIKQEYHDILHRVAAFANGDQAITFMISGHTDSSGATGYNQSLGARRADSVKSFLIKNF